MTLNEDNSEVLLSLNSIDNYLENIYLNLDIGDYFFELKKYDKSTIKYKKALEISILGTLNFHDENKFFELEELLRVKLYQSLIKKGIDLFNNKKYEESLDLYSEALDINSTDSEVYYRLGQCFYELKNNDLALKYLEKSLIIDPDYSESYRVLGDIYYSLNDYRNSIKNYEEFTLLNDQNEYVYNMLGHLHYKSHNIKRALLYFQLSLNMNPFFQIAHSNFLYTTVKMPDFSQEETYNLAVNTANGFIENNCVIDDNLFHHEKRSNNKKIRIAYLSGDIKAHVVMNYILPILKNHNKNDFEVHCYYNNDEDWITHECKKIF
jgi:protein O-GlcNAc transferase